MSKAKKKTADKGMFIRPTVSQSDFDFFQAACRENGETITSVVRRVIVKIARGDSELLNRIIT
jgi:hypothetical protein